MGFNNIGFNANNIRTASANPVNSNRNTNNSDCQREEGNSRRSHGFSKEAANALKSIVLAVSVTACAFSAGKAVAKDLQPQNNYTTPLTSATQEVAEEGVGSDDYLGSILDVVKAVKKSDGDEEENA